LNYFLGWPSTEDNTIFFEALKIFKNFFSFFNQKIETIILDIIIVPAFFRTSLFKVNKITSISKTVPNNFQKHSQSQLSTQFASLVHVNFICHIVYVSIAFVICTDEKERSLITSLIANLDTTYKNGGKTKKSKSSTSDIIIIFIFCCCLTHTWNSRREFLFFSQFFSFLQVFTDRKKFYVTIRNSFIFNIQLRNFFSLIVLFLLLYHFLSYQLLTIFHGINFFEEIFFGLWKIFSLKIAKRARFVEKSSYRSRRDLPTNWDWIFARSRRSYESVIFTSRRSLSRLKTRK
jgi:hypothetical protein